MPRTGPLDAQHRALGAKMGAFAGWDMPISYAGTIAEHTAVRERVGLFDVSHLGKVRVRGEGAAAFLDTQLTNTMASLPAGRARYSLICRPDGGIIDDLIVYGLREHDYLVVPNAANRDAVAAVLAAAVPAGVSVEVEERTTLALQGPRAPELIEELYPATKAMGYMHVVADGDVVIARSGYTGERGYEVFTEVADAARVWERLLEATRAVDGEVCGLAARDTLRLEMGYPLHGNDISHEVTPLESGLGWAVKTDGRAFPGRDALVEAPPRTALIGLRMRDRLIPRAGQRAGSGGIVTSGTFSPTLRVGIALARVPTPPLPAGSGVEVDVRGKVGFAEVMDPPFVVRSPK